LRDWPDLDAFVAEVEGAIVGLCHVQGGRMLVSDGYACEWAYARGYGQVRLRSGVQRKKAHAFYEHLGFQKAKASYAFELRKA
jgi:hypothetical protein